MKKVIVFLIVLFMVQIAWADIDYNNTDVYYLTANNCQTNNVLRVGQVWQWKNTNSKKEIVGLTDKYVIFRCFGNPPEMVFVDTIETFKKYNEPVEPPEFKVGQIWIEHEVYSWGSCFPPTYAEILEITDKYIIFKKIYPTFDCLDADTKEHFRKNWPKLKLESTETIADINN